jgi:hypothetical protein
MTLKEAMVDLGIPEKTKTMKKLLYLAIIILAIVSCKTVKKVEKIRSVVAKKDTAQTVYVEDVPKIDSAAIVKGIMTKVMKKKIDFSTFNAKIKVDYDGVDIDQKVTAYVSIKKDSAIYIKIAVSPLGVMEQILIDREHVYLMNMKKGKKLTVQPFSYLQEATNIRLDFSTLQDLLVGNPVFIDSNIVTYKNTSKELLVLMVGNLYKHLLTLSNADFRVLHSKLDDVDVTQNRTCDITFGNYQNINGRDFAMYREISVSQKDKVDIILDCKEASFNDPLKYTVDISKNYKQK